MADQIPHDIILDILLRLPTKSLSRFRCVCKTWRSLISDPNFIREHLKRQTQNNSVNLMFNSKSTLYSINNNALFHIIAEAVPINFQFKYRNFRPFGIEILGSCDGLLFLQNSDNVNCLFNPCTKEFKKIPLAPSVECRSKICSFGYDPSTNDYKVVRMVYTGWEYDCCEVDVFSLRTNTWRRIADTPHWIPYSTACGLYVNGALHWCNIALNSITAFDLADEKSKDVSLTQLADLNDDFVMNTCVFGGSLCICLYFRDYSGIDENRLDIWVMKEYGVKDSWTKIFTISHPDVAGPFGLEPLSFSKTGELVLGSASHDLLVLYNPKHSKTRTRKIFETSEDFQVITYVESYVSLKSDSSSDK